MIKESNNLLITALDFATENHKNQFRQSGEPYVEHPKRVRAVLAEAGFGEAVQIAGLLHDVIEDGSSGARDIRSLFGEDVAMMVEAVSKWPKGGQRPKRLDFFPGLDHPSEADFRMYWYVARMEGYARAWPHCLAIKAADQADNIVDYGPGVDKNKIRKKLSEVSQVFLPVYRRLRGVFPAEDVPKFERVLDHLQRSMLRMRREFGYDLFA